MLEQSLTQLLYKYDPADTQCGFYKSYDEYKIEAKAIVHLLSVGVPFKHAYFSVLTHYFWVDMITQETFMSISLEYYNHVV